MRYELVLFDLDGTTLNTLGDLTDGVNAALREKGMPGRTEEEVLSFVGNGIRQMISLAVPDGTDGKTVDETCAAFRAYYAEHCMDRTVPYEGVVELLRDLRKAGIRTAVISNKDEQLVSLMCGRLLEGQVDRSVGSGGKYPRKPDPAGALSVPEALGIPKDKTLYVGDSAVDVKTAENAGLSGVFVSWGFAGGEKLRAMGVPVVDTAEELRALILGGYSVRPAEDADVPSLLALLEQVLAVHHEARPDLFKPAGGKYGAEDLRALIRNAETPVFVCLRPDGSVCGHCFSRWETVGESGARYAEKTLYVDDLCVDGSERRKGAGETLYRFVRAYAEENGADSVTLHVWEGNGGAEGFYRNMGLRVRYRCLEEKIGKEKPEEN